ncbi:hypothetical protein [Streptomyces olivaceoviridis]
MIGGIRRECGPDFRIGWHLSIERYGLRLEELREMTAEIFDRELIDYLDLAPWDYHQIVQEGSFRGRTLLNVFADLPRNGGAAGRIRSAGRATRLLNEGCDFVLIGRAGILERNCPVLVESDAPHESPALPVPADFLRKGGLSERFIDHLRGWGDVVRPGSL